MTPAERYKSSVKKDRNAWRDLWHHCMVCWNRTPLQVHEIEKKSSAQRRWGVRCNYLALCVDCHYEIEHQPAEWPHARQLAVKALRDPVHFSLDEWLEIKPRAATYVNNSEIHDAIESEKRRVCSASNRQKIH